MWIRVQSGEIVNVDNIIKITIARNGENGSKVIAAHSGNLDRTTLIELPDRELCVEFMEDFHAYAENPNNPNKNRLKVWFETGEAP